MDVRFSRGYLEARFRDFSGRHVLMARRAPQPPKGPTLQEMLHAITTAKNLIDSGRAREGIRGLEGYVHGVITSGNFRSEQNILAIRLIAEYRRHRIFEADCQTGITPERWDRLEAILKRSAEAAAELAAPGRELSLAERFQVPYFTQKDVIPPADQMESQFFRPFAETISRYQGLLSDAKLIDSEPQPAAAPVPTPAPKPRPPAPTPEFPPIRSKPMPAPAPRLEPRPPIISVPVPRPTLPPPPPPPPPVPAKSEPTPAQQAADPFIRSGVGFLGYKRYKEAALAFRQALSHDPENTPALNGINECARGLLALADAEIARRNLKAAGTFLRQAEEPGPTDAVLIGRIAQSKRRIAPASIPIPPPRSPIPAPTPASPPARPELSRTTAEAAVAAAAAAQEPKPAPAPSPAPLPAPFSAPPIAPKPLIRKRVGHNPPKPPLPAAEIAAKRRVVIDWFLADPKRGDLSAGNILEADSKIYWLIYDKRLFPGGIKEARAAAVPI